MFIVPNIPFNSSRCFRRTTSRKAWMTVSVFDANPIATRASSINPSGKSKVVRI